MSPFSGRNRLASTVALTAIIVHSAKVAHTPKISSRTTGSWATATSCAAATNRSAAANSAWPAINKTAARGNLPSYIRLPITATAITTTIMHTYFLRIFYKSTFSKVYKKPCALFSRDLKAFTLTTYYEIKPDYVRDRI